MSGWEGLGKAIGGGNIVFGGGTNCHMEGLVLSQMIDDAGWKLAGTIVYRGIEDTGLGTRGWNKPVLGTRRVGDWVVGWLGGGRYLHQGHTLPSQHALVHHALPMKQKQVTRHGFVTARQRHQVPGYDRAAAHFLPAPVTVYV